MPNTVPNRTCWAHDAPTTIGIIRCFIMLDWFFWVTISQPQDCPKARNGCLINSYVFWSYMDVLVVIIPNSIKKVIKTIGFFSINVVHLCWARKNIKKNPNTYKLVLVFFLHVVCLVTTATCDCLFLHEAPYVDTLIDVSLGHFQKLDIHIIEMT